MMGSRHSPEPKLTDCTCARPGCDEVFVVRKSELRHRPRRYCSRVCANRHRQAAISDAGKTP
jgi:hypothetical protein